MFSLKRSKPPYTQEQIKEQQGIVSVAMIQRDAFDKDDNPEDYDRASTSVECAQEILNYMLEEVSHSYRK